MTKIVVKDDEVTLGSPEEAVFYGILRLWEVPVERTTPLWPEGRSDGKYQWRPGFYLPEMAIWAEVKGVAGPEDPPRWAVWREGGRRLAVLGREELKVLARCSGGGIIERQLNNWATDETWTPEGGYPQGMNDQVEAGSVVHFCENPEGPCRRAEVARLWEDPPGVQRADLRLQGVDRQPNPAQRNEDHPKAGHTWHAFRDICDPGYF